LAITGFRVDLAEIQIGLILAAHVGKNPDGLIETLVKARVPRKDCAKRWHSDGGWIGAKFTPVKLGITLARPHTEIREPTESDSKRTMASTTAEPAEVPALKLSDFEARLVSRLL